ncbi:50S ribosomal protein L10 [Candidatus Nanohalococcus occultus]|uniref:Large ribosomal subunit protein uL10 n=1 Tax=Candidatus Nanohalococcus occultus TaxID=2978047 RepID=A0ABY8CD44_9ARCH|nr:Ribosomal protein L10 [Candidatus Nanohaloarchaeota archaeon SVXNc]
MVQPTPKQMSREEKEAKVEEFQENIENFDVVGVLDMHSLPARQLQDIKKEMKEFATVRMSRKTLMDLALENSDRDGVDQLDLNEAVQPAFIFSEKDPFQLFSLIKKNKTSAAAQGGEIAPTDIEVDEGDTGIGPGPMLGKLQQAGLQVQVDDGSIHVTKSGVIIEQGEEITREDADLLNQLGIEPLEIGLDLKLAFAQDQVFTREDLDIDTEAYRKDVEAAAIRSFNLAVNAGVINDRTASTIVSKAVQNAKNLAISEGLPVKETIKEALALAASSSRGLESQLDLEDVDLDEAEDDESEAEESEEESDDSEDESEDESEEEADEE